MTEPTTTANQVSSSDLDDGEHHPSLTTNLLQQNATIWPELETVQQRKINVLVGTGIDGKPAEYTRQEPVPIERIYPHVFDDNAEGQAVVHIRNAVEDARLAIDAFGEPDFREVDTRLIQIAASMGKTHSLTHIDESLGAAASFIRRAVLATSSAEVSRSSLNALLNALQEMAANPMLDLDDATDLIDKLSDEHWHGNSKYADAIVTALIDSSGLTDELRDLVFHKSEKSEEVGENG